MPLESSQLNRRGFLKLLGAGAAAAGAAGLPLTHFASSAHAQAGPAKKPNVLFIAIDDLNDWIGCLGGHPDAKTPNLDRLASRGTLFTNAHCPAPLCNASRAALMTGIRTASTGVYGNNQPFRLSTALANAETLPMHFRAAGYEAFGAGKIYHGAFPDPQSWDRYWPSQEETQPHDPMPEKRPASMPPPVSNFDWGPIDVADDDMGDGKITRWAEGELAKKHDKPFFMAVGVYKPHLPWYVPRKYFEMFPPEKITLPNVNEHDLDDIPEAGRKIAKAEGDHKRVIEAGQWRKAVSSYLACIAFADAMVGRVIDAYDRSPDRDNTTIVLWSDHGWHLGEKLHWRKFSLWEEATHNVLMVVAPGVTKPGTKCARTVNLLDLYPTLVDLCALPPKSGLDGVSLMPLLKDPSAKWDRPAVTTFMRGNHSVRSEDWRYIRYADGSEELYDHKKDELEWTNLATDAKYAEVKKDLAKWLPTTNAEDSPKRKGGEE